MLCVRKACLLRSFTHFLLVDIGSKTEAGQRHARQLRPQVGSRLSDRKFCHYMRETETLVGVIRLVGFRSEFSGRVAPAEG